MTTKIFCNSEEIDEGKLIRVSVYYKDCFICDVWVNQRPPNSTMVNICDGLDSNVKLKVQKYGSN